MTGIGPIEGDPDAAVLVVVVNDLTDLSRACDEGWYRIPLLRAPRRIAAEYLAFYQTGAFPADQRWQVRYVAPVRGYNLTTRRELIPSEPLHPRADDLYYRVALGPVQSLPAPIPSRRLRRITFIASTLGRLYAAAEINDLWIRSGAHERLWQALQDADLDAEYQYPLFGEEDEPVVTADFALPCHRGGVAVVLTDGEDAAGLREEQMGGEYRLAAIGWTLVRIPLAAGSIPPSSWAARLAALCIDLGGIL